MTWYLSVDAMQPPFDLGLDGAGRAMYAFNVMGRKKASETFLEEMLAVIEAGTTLERGTDLFVTAYARIPSGSGPYLTLIESGGTVERTQNETAPTYHRPTAQVAARAKDPNDARDCIYSAYDALVAVSNETVTT